MKKNLIEEHGKNKWYDFDKYTQILINLFNLQALQELHQAPPERAQYVSRTKRNLQRT